MTTSASCSIDPLSRRSLRIGRLSGRCSGARLSCEIAITGMRSSRASPFSAREIDETRSEEHTSELQSQSNLVCRLLLEKKNQLLPPDVHRGHVDSRSLDPRRAERPPAGLLDYRPLGQGVLTDSPRYPAAVACATSLYRR